MNQNITFIYKYSAKKNREVEEIRRKYSPREESKLEELKRLDNTVQGAGMVESLCTGIGGALVFGFGMCLTMQVLGSGMFLTAFGVILGVAGICGMIAAYPVYRRIYLKAKGKYAPRILELADMLSNENN